MPPIPINYTNLNKLYLSGVGGDVLNLDSSKGNDDKGNDGYMLNYLKNVLHLKNHDKSIDAEKINTILKEYADSDPKTINKEIIQKWKVDAIIAMRDAYEMFRVHQFKDKEDGRHSPKEAWKHFVRAFKKELFFVDKTDPSVKPSAYEVPGVKLSDAKLKDIARIRFFKYGVLDNVKSISRRQEEWLKMTRNGEQTHEIFQAFLRRYKRCITVEEARDDLLKTRYQKSVYDSYVGPVSGIITVLLVYKTITACLYLKEIVGGQTGMMQHTGYVDKLYHLAVRSSVWRHIFGSKHLFEKDQTETVRIKGSDELVYEQIYTTENLSALKRVRDLNAELEDKTKQFNEASKDEGKDAANVAALHAQMVRLAARLKEPAELAFKRGHNYFTLDEMSAGPYTEFFSGTRTMFDILTSHYSSEWWNRWMMASWWYTRIDERLRPGYFVKKWLVLFGTLIVFIALSVAQGYGLLKFVPWIFRNFLIFWIFVIIIVIVSFIMWVVRRYNRYFDSGKTGEKSTDEVTVEQRGNIVKRLWFDVLNARNYVNNQGKIKRYPLMVAHLVVLLFWYILRYASVVFLTLGIFLFNLKSASSQGGFINKCRLGLVCCVFAFMVLLCYNVSKANGDLDDEVEERREKVQYWENLLVRYDPKKYGSEGAFHMLKFEALFGVFRAYDNEKLGDSDYDINNPNKCHSDLGRNDDDISTKIGPFLALGVVVLVLALQVWISRSAGLGGQGDKGTLGKAAKLTMEDLKRMGPSFIYKWGVLLFTCVIAVLTVVVWYIENASRPVA